MELPRAAVEINRIHDQVWAIIDEIEQTDDDQVKLAFVDSLSALKKNRDAVLTEVFK